jgi:hypothetical protein
MTQRTREEFAAWLHNPDDLWLLFESYYREGFNTDILEGFLQSVVIPKLPAGHKWKFLWCSESEHSADANQLAELLLANQYGTSFHHQDQHSNYLAGRYDNRNSWATWLEWGIGCPMASAPAEIWVAVDVNEA